MSDYQVDISTNLNIPLIKDDWLSLENNTTSNFFMSWHWLGTWLETYNPQVKIIRIYFADKLVAMAFLVEHTEIRHKVFPYKTLRLNHTGLTRQDQIWSEYNGFLALDEHHDRAIARCISVLEKKGQWDEFITGVITEERSTFYRSLPRFLHHIRWDTKGYAVDFSQIKSDKYLATLSRNTRYQINKTRKQLSAIGEITLEFAKDREQALNFLAELGPIHIERWKDCSDYSGFINPDFVLFHKNLISNNWQNKSIQIVRVSVGSKIIAYFYNFIYRQKVYFYLSAIEYKDLPQNAQPGLLSHSLCIQYYIDKGYSVYDFLGGDARYKKSLSNTQYHLMVLSLQRKTLKIFVERSARKVKRCLRSMKLA